MKFELEEILRGLGGTIRASIQPHIGQPVTHWSAAPCPPICKRGGKCRFRVIDRVREEHQCGGLPARPKGG
jgi:hypothetical protein